MSCRVLLRAVCFVCFGVSSAFTCSTLFAGNIRASISGGNLILHGDKNSNDIFLVSPTNGTVTVESGPDDTINGTASPVNLTGWTGGIYAYLNEGDDNLTFLDLIVRGPVHVDLGSGNDSFVGFSSDFVVSANSLDAKFQIQKSLLVLGGSGSDFVYLGGGVIAGNVTLDLGSGDDSILLGNGSTVSEGVPATLFKSNVLILPGAGVDDVGLYNVMAELDLTIDDPVGSNDLVAFDLIVNRNLFVYTSNEADMLYFLNVYVDDLAKIITKDGADDVTLEFFDSDRLETYLGSGNDFLTLAPVNANRFWGYLEGGNDVLNIHSSNLRRSYIYGGAGNDDLYNYFNEGTEWNIYGEGGNDTLDHQFNTIEALRVYTVESR